MFRTGGKNLFDDRCVLAHCAKHTAYRVWSLNRTQAKWEEYMVSRRHT